MNRGDFGDPSETAHQKAGWTGKSRQRVSQSPWGSKTPFSGDSPEHTLDGMTLAVRKNGKAEVVGPAVLEIPLAPLPKPMSKNPWRQALESEVIL